MPISESYRQQNAELHNRYASYGTSSKRWHDKVNELSEKLNPKSILDYGCGKGLLAAGLPALSIREYDPAIPGKDKIPESADLVICTDVLEHVEPDMLEAVLSDLARVTQLCAFLNIAIRPAKKVLSDGRNAHLIIEPPEWWQAHIERFFTILSWDVVPQMEVNALVAPTAQAEAILSQLALPGHVDVGR
ncbi:class I SAM-dependent methyltransferase [Methylobacterium tarhaniae]|uniref:class I SAM-dependent methyltransferase n=1 Tax=Methylobacterium tarhaniae TaxID=1187852 RepID=UPI000A59FC87|nr:class I SAM-dependent methyltransferase [Methylobacterium tarhaniae]